MRNLLLSLALLSTPLVVLADNGPGCGPGASIWKGKTGLVAHTSAGTTNTSFSSPSAGIYSGTSGCENPGLVNNKYMEKVFVSLNLDDLAKDVARGNGDHLASMATLMGIKETDHSSFFQLTQSSYDQIFASSDNGYVEVLAALNIVMLADSRFAHYIK